MSKKITMRKIAEHAAVGLGTVGRVFRDHPGVSPDTRRQVLETAQALGYRHLPRDRRLRIGVVLPASPVQITGYVAGILDAVCHRISALGHQMELIREDDLEVLNDQLLSGVLSLSWSHDFNQRFLECSTLPLVRINGEPDHLNNIYCVLPDGPAVMEEIIDELFRLGHWKIAFAAEDSRSAESRKCSNRFRGFCEALMRRGIQRPERDCFFRINNYSPEQTARSLEILRKLPEAGYTALVMPGETMGMRLHQMLSSAGIRVPDDLSVIVWEQADVSAFMDPPMTAASIDYHAMASAALELLITLLHGDGTPDDRLIRYTLISRQSVRARR